LAHAITLLAKSTRQSSDTPTRVREPDQFDGSDPRKLQAFMVQLELNFRDRPKMFKDDKAKVNYALSYLKGVTLDWFEPNIIDPVGFAPAWIDSWVLFSDQLQKNFSPHDPMGEAKAELEQLRMRENHHITKYMVEFNQITAHLCWGQHALRHQFYKGLLDRIKDDMACIRKPGDVDSMRKLAQEIDARYWECQNEIACNKRSGNSKGNNSDSSDNTKKPDKKKGKQNPSNSKSDSDQQPRSNNSDKQPKASGSGSGSGNQCKPDLSSKLGKDGKLTPEERQCHFNNNLCLFCGGTGHTAKECTKAGSSATKSKAHATKPQNSEAKAEDAKKD
jgi:hypothetical protein